jgi:large subunit ribosomal protein L31
MAHKKAGSSSKNGRDSVGQRLGVKVGDGQLVPAGSIIVRQRGQTFLAGNGAALARDYTVFATTTGHVRFEHATKSKKRIRVISADEVAATAARVAATDHNVARGGDARQRLGSGSRGLEENCSRRSPAGRWPCTDDVEEIAPVKPDIHPKYYEAKVHCGSCGTEWTVGSTRPELRVDVCSNCHPFFTGKQTIIDTAGQVERFQKRLERQTRS